MPSARDSRQATLSILRERLETATQRTQCLQEVEADLSRIEHKVELVLEKATLQANPTEVAFTTIQRIVEAFVGDRIAQARINLVRPPVTDRAALAVRFGWSLPEQRMLKSLRNPKLVRPADLTGPIDVQRDL